MTPAQREELRRELIDRLTEIYRKVRTDLSAAVVDRAMESDPTDEAEESVHEELRDLAARLGDRERMLAHAIEDALRRLRNQDFGVCIDCGREIPYERLRVVPWTLRCADDQERVERTHGAPTL